MGKKKVDNTKEVVENVRRILTCDVSKLSGKDLDFRLAYERGKKEYEEQKKFEKYIFKGGDLREHLYDFGYQIETSEMKRDFYLKNRINQIERKKILDVFEILRYSAIKDYLAFGFAVLGVGTSTYLDKYFSELEKYLLEHNLSKEDFILEEAKSYEKEAEDFENYEAYLDYWKKENSSRPFDEKITPFTKQVFLDCKKRDQKSYSKKKKIGEILNRKGEDLDFVVCHDYNYSLGDCYKEEMKKFKNNFINLCKEKNYNLIDESSYLDGADYWFDGEKLVRWKEIGCLDCGKTLRISFEKGRSFHFYFRDELANLKVREEKIRNYPFVQLIRKGNYDDLKNTILHGEKTGIFENPFYSRKI